MTGPMSADEALAVARLRQYAATRCALLGGKTLNLRNPGRPNADSSHARHDAIVIRVIDFERALSTLEPAESVALILCYRDHASYPSIAQALGCSTSKLTYLIPAARKHLADELDRRNLL
jgi:DNA-directed RNA polymerase specialized sigma24 family protein